MVEATVWGLEPGTVEGSIYVLRLINDLTWGVGGTKKMKMLILN